MHKLNKQAERKPSRSNASARLRGSSRCNTCSGRLPGSAMPETQFPIGNVPIGCEKRGTDEGTCRKCLQMPAKQQIRVNKY